MNALEIIRQEQLRLLDIAESYVALTQQAQAEANKILNENARLSEALEILGKTSLEANDANESTAGEDQHADPRELAPGPTRADVDQQDEERESPTEEGGPTPRPGRGRRTRVDRGPEADRGTEVGEGSDGGSTPQNEARALIEAAARAFNLSPALIRRGESGPVTCARRAIVLAGVRQGFTVKQLAQELEACSADCQLSLTLAWSEAAAEPRFEELVQQVQREFTSGKA